jgi:hypothetical protein
MDTRKEIAAGFALLCLLAGAPATTRSYPKGDKSVLNYDGGVIFATDGSLPNGACFRVRGLVSADTFFEHFKRVDDDRGTVFVRGSETVSTFPDKLDVSFTIHDEPCSPDLRDFAGHPSLTREMMAHIQLYLYWKHGVDLRPVPDVRAVETRVERVMPYAREVAAQLPDRFEWSYQLSVPSAGVPLTDSLVFVFRFEGHRIAARVAARL